MYRQNVSLIMTVYNEGDNILQFLDSYQQQTAYASEFIIVDGGSTDNTAEAILEYSRNKPELKIKLIIDTSCSRKHVKGPIARGRNRAILEAVGPIIAASDAGCVLDNNWLEEISKPFDGSDKVDVVAGFFRLTKNNAFQNKFADIFIPLEDNYLPSSRSIAFTKDSWAKVGGYPEGSYTAEDSLFDIMLLKSGCKFTWNKNALVTWDFARDKNDLRKKLRQYGYGEGYNLMFAYKYAYRMLCLLFPPFMFPKLLLHGKKKNLDFITLYFFYYNQSRGFVAGLVDRLKNG